MEITKILSMCVEEDVELNVDGNDLEVSFDDYPSDELLSYLKEYKKEVVEYLIGYKKNVRQSIARKAIPVVDRTNNEMLLSFAQQRLWFIDQLQDGSAEYNMPAALQIEGELDLSAAEQALVRIINRLHPSVC